MEAQGKTHLLPFKNFTYPWGPWVSLILNIVIILVQGWSSFSPRFAAVDFVSYYVELPIMLLMFVGWKLYKRTKLVSYADMDLETDVYVMDEDDVAAMQKEKTARGRVEKVLRWIF